MSTHVHSSIIQSSPKVDTPQCPSMDQWINKVWYIHTMEYYSAVKREEPMTYVKTWMDLEDIMLIETSQSQKRKFFMILLV